MFRRRRFRGGRGGQTERSLSNPSFLHGQKQRFNKGITYTPRSNGASEVVNLQYQATKLKIDQNRCIGCGTCATLCPSMFEIGPNRKARVKNNDANNDCDLQAVINACPVGAISFED
jgi:ferredoxin